MYVINAKKTIQIFCAVSDGQWIKDINQDIEGKPLTRFQFQKQYLNNVSMVRDQTLSRWSEATEILMVDGTHTISNITVTSTTINDAHGNM